MLVVTATEDLTSKPNASPNDELPKPPLTQYLLLTAIGKTNEVQPRRRCYTVVILQILLKFVTSTGKQRLKNIYLHRLFIYQKGAKYLSTAL